MSMYDLKTREGCTRQAAFKNACDCLYYGYGQNVWNSCGLGKAESRKVWKQAIDYMARS